MAAPVGLQSNGVPCLCLDSSVVAGIEGRGVGSRFHANVADMVPLKRSVVLQSSAVAKDRGGRASLHCVNSKIGFRGFKLGWTDEQLECGADGGGRMMLRVAAVAPQADFEARPESKVTYIPLELIGSEVEFDRILREAQERNEPIIIEWMASWCRKCLYLKPKLEKLAAVFHPNIKFYYVDVNSVPQAMVKRAEVTQMPTIQLWRNGAQEAQVIGGHQANTVVDLVKDMIGKGMPRV